MPQSNSQSNPHTNTDKSPVAAYLLWFFLGWFGVHRFYMGRTPGGLGMLGLFIASAVLSVVGIGLFGYLALTVWWVVDAFLMRGWFNNANPAANYGDQSDHNDTNVPPMSQAA